MLYLHGVDTRIKRATDRIDALFRKACRWKLTSEQYNDLLSGV